MVHDQGTSTYGILGEPVSDLTIIYYSANTEDPAFEQKIREVFHVAIGNRPVVSVTHKPVNIGRNICIDDSMPVSLATQLYQIKLGALVAQTTYVAMVESDCLYHDSYFNFRPSTEDTFAYTDNFYLLWEGKRKIFWSKRRREFSCITGRKHLIDVIEQVQEELPEYSVRSISKHTAWELFHPEVATISIKTMNGMHRRAPINKKKWTRELPYWGSAADVHRMLFGR